MQNLKRNQKTNRQSKILLLIIVISYFPMLFFCNSPQKGASTKNDSNYDTTFIPALWKSNNLYLRGRMVKDLMTRYSLDSISKDSLIRLLGKPLESNNDFCSYLFSSRDTLVINQNYMLLYFRLDSSTSRVNKYWITD
jgi:hypothetical protein